MGVLLRNWQNYDQALFYFKNDSFVDTVNDSTTYANIQN
jgi:hypothetical protein